MATRNSDDPLSSLFSPDDAGSADPPEPQHLRPAVKPVNRTSVPPIPAPQVGPDPAQLAKILARAAVAKAGKLQKAPPKAPASAAPFSAAPTPAEPAKTGFAAAPPPRKSLSLAEAMDAARVAESAKAKEASKPVEATPAATAASSAASASASLTAAPAPAAVARPVATSQGLTDAIQGLIQAVVPGAALYVPAAVLVQERAVLKPLWKAHRARLLAAGDFERAVAAGAVVSALNTRPADAIAAAHVVLDGGEFLAWFDLDLGTPIAAFAEPRAWGLSFP